MTSALLATSLARHLYDKGALWIHGQIMNCASVKTAYDVRHKFRKYLKWSWIEITAE